MRSGAFGIAPAQLQRDGFHVGRERDDRFAEPLRLGGDQAASRGAGHAELLLGTLEEDLAVEEAVIEVLPGCPVVAEFAIAADLHADPPAGFGEVHPTLREDRAVFLGFFGRGPGDGPRTRRVVHGCGASWESAGADTGL